MTSIFYSVSQKNSPEVFCHFPKRLGTSISPNFTRLLHVPIYARKQIFIQSDFISNCDEVMYAILSATTQRAFRPMVDILNI